MGAAFGGGSNTLFGSGGAGNILTKITTTSAVLFMVTSIFLVKLSATQAGATVSDPLAGSVMTKVAAAPATEEVAKTGSVAGEAGAAKKTAGESSAAPQGGASVDVAPGKAAGSAESSKESKK